MLGGYCGDRVAPAWFTSALQQNLLAVETRITDKLTVMDSKLTVVDSKLAVVDCKLAVVDSKLAVVDSKLAVVDSKIAVVDSKIAVLDSKISNGTALEDSDTLIPPQLNPIESPPPACPTTLHAMCMLETGQDLTSIENYYALSHTGSLKSRLNRLRRMYGVSSIL